MIWLVVLRIKNSSIREQGSSSIGIYQVGGKDAEAPGRCEYLVCYSNASIYEHCIDSLKNLVKTKL